MRARVRASVPAHVRRSIVVRPAVPPSSASRVAPVHSVPRAASAQPIIAAPRPRVQSAPAARDHCSPTSPFGSPAVDLGALTK